MNKTLFKIGLGFLALAGVAWPACGAPSGLKTLHGLVPAVVPNLAPLGRVNATNILHLAIGLPLRNQQDLNSLLQQINDPSSPNYHKVLSPDEFVAQFGPTEADDQSIIDFAKANGFTVTGISSNRTLVDVSGRVSDIEKAFHVTLHSYQHPTENRQFFAPDSEPLVDSSVPVLSVSGLNNYILPKPLNHRGLSKNQTFGGFATGSAPGGSYWGYDFRNAYAPGVALTGTGQKVALFELDGYFPTDVSSYLQASGLPAVTLANVLIDGFTGQPSGTGGEVEVALDIDMANAMAPGLNEIVVYEAPNSSSGVIDELNRIATDNLALQISSSWGIGDSPLYDQIYIQFALQGQSFFQASGDLGAYYPGISESADAPLATLVGGTTLTSTGPGGVWNSEQVWNIGFDSSVGHEWAGGGGISQVYSIPSWQTNINMTANQGSTTMRNSPDVALTADNIFIWGDGSQIPDEGGTSAAAPLWAGFMALVNQQIATDGKAPLGFINPGIYALAQNTNFVYTNLFHDIIVGNNTNDVQTILFSAVPGYDLCSGWGTPNGTNLIDALVSLAPVIPTFPVPKQPWGNSLSVMNGANPNGLWLFFMQDDTLNNYSGTNYNGWTLNLTTANPVGYAADNQLYINVTNVLVAPGNQWVTTLSVTNYGPSSSTNVYINDLLPPASGIGLVSTSSTIASSSLNFIGDTLVWNVGNLPANTGGTLSLTLKANSPGFYTNGATVFATTSDPNPDDDSVGTSITVAVTTPPIIAPRFVLGSGGALQLSVTNDSGSTIIIQASTNLLSWSPVFTNTAPFTFTNFDSTNFQKRFYRAVTSP